LTLNIRNLGSKSLEIGTPYIIFREYENGAIEEFNFSSVWGNWAWAASLLCLSPFGTYSQNILTDLEPGEYFVVKEYTAEGSVKYTKDLYFTVE